MSNKKNYVAMKIGVLEHLRDLFHRRARTREVLPLDFTLVAADLGVSEEDVSSTIAELCRLGLAKATNGKSNALAVSQGECEITDQGLTDLHHYEMSIHLSPQVTSLRPAGFKP